jgi:RNA polymerase sigma-70 factor (ECF subfamily)
MESKEAELIGDLIRQSRTAQQQLLARYGPSVYRTVQRIVGCQEDAEEVYQDVFVKALRSIGTYDSRLASLGTWLSRIAYHEALNFVRKARPTLLSIDDEGRVSESETDEGGIAKEASIEQLERGMELLPAEERALLTMFYYDGMSLSEIAYVEGSNASTIGSKLCRIRKKLYKITKTL